MMKLKNLKPTDLAKLTKIMDSAEITTVDIKRINSLLHKILVHKEQVDKLLDEIMKELNDKQINKGGGANK